MTIKGLEAVWTIKSNPRSHQVFSSFVSLFQFPLQNYHEKKIFEKFYEECLDPYHIAEKSDVFTQVYSLSPCLRHSQPIFYTSYLLVCL